MSRVSEMRRLLPTFKHTRDVIKHEQTVVDIVKEVQAAHRAFAVDYDKIAKAWMDGPLHKVPKELYRFCDTYFEYKEEPAKNQTTRSPAACLAMKKVDCKHYSGFIAGVLDAINRTGVYYYDWYYRFVSEEFTPAPHHVFVVIKTEDGENCWVDPVPEVGGFDKRPFYIWKYDRKPKVMLSRLSGLNNRTANVTTVSRHSMDVKVPTIRPYSAALGATTTRSVDYMPATTTTPTQDTYLPVPAGYPTTIPRPVLTADGRLVLRDHLKQWLSDANVQWVQGALQPLIVKYSTTPYNIYWSIKDWGSGKGEIIFDVLRNLNQTEKNYLLYPRMPSGLDKVLMGINDILPSLLGTAANSLVPGSGSTVTSSLQSGSSTPNNAVNLTPEQLQALQQQQNPTGTGLVNNAVNYAKQNPVTVALIGLAVLAGGYYIFKE